MVIKNDYKYIYTIVKEVINKTDPINLLSQGAPKDEYDEEIRKIVSGISKCNNVKEIQKLVFDIFREQFGEETAGNIDLYLEAARNIFENLTK